MKYLLVSDIHGSWPRLEQILQHVDNMKIDMFIILGDILNYGPRNSVPEGLNAQKIADALNKINCKIIAVRGNCDSEVDQMLLDFPMMSDYTIIVDEGIRMFITHGHVYNEEKMPKTGFDIFVYGHTHLQKLEQNNGITICNTGSITFPKGGNVPTFATYSNGVMRIHSLDGSILREQRVK